METYKCRFCGSCFRDANACCKHQSVCSVMLSNQSDAIDLDSIDYSSDEETGGPSQAKYTKQNQNQNHNPFANAYRDRGFSNSLNVAHSESSTYVKKDSNSNTRRESSTYFQKQSDTQKPNQSFQHLNMFSGHRTRNQVLAMKGFRSKHKKQEERDRKAKVSSIMSVRMPFKWKPRREKRKVPPREPHPQESFPMDSFFGQLGLVTKSCASKLQEQHKSQDVDLDCEIVAVEGPAFEELQSPRTTRSLMAQTRRSMEEARRRLSFNGGEADMDEFEAAAARIQPAGSLLNIPVTSPLGLKLDKHMLKDAAIIPGSISDFDKYCTTEFIDEFSSKLRQRTSEYPIMRGRRKGLVIGYCHRYKFNAADRREAMRVLQTGLNREGRRLKRLCRRVTVSLVRLKKEEIKMWTTKRRTIVNQEIEIDDDLSIVQVEVPEAIFTHMQKLPVPVTEHRARMQDR